MRGWRRFVTGFTLAGLAVALAGGCASGSGSAAGAGATGKPGGNVAAFDARAKLVAAAWDRAGLAKEWLTGLVVIDPG